MALSTLAAAEERLSLADHGSELLHAVCPSGPEAVGSDVLRMQTLDERLDLAMSTLAAAEERLSLADHDGMLLMQQRDEALHRCPMPEPPSLPCRELLITVTPQFLVKVCCHPAWHPFRPLAEGA